MSDIFNPKHEPEVEARRFKVAVKPETWALIAKGIVACAALGLMLGGCVAGFMLPIKGVQWLFAG